MRVSTKYFAALLLGAALSIPAGIPAAAADTGPPQGGGGCNMVIRGTSGTTNGLDQMMAGAQNGKGQTNMFVMLDRFGC
jgi:hypothetical protein